MNTKPKTVNEYLDGLDPAPREIMDRVRAIVKQRVPEAEECLSYGVPSFRLKKVFFHYSTFKAHLGIYPPLPKDHPLRKTLAPYANDKGNLKFLFKDPIPYDLIGGVAEALATEYGKGD